MIKEAIRLVDQVQEQVHFILLLPFKYGEERGGTLLLDYYSDLGVVRYLNPSY